MGTLFTLQFQGEVTAEGPLASDEERELVRSAFLTTPPRDASTREGFRAWKIAPLSSGRSQLSTIASTGEVDGYGRPILRATGCVLDRGEMHGALRDLSAVWQALVDGEVEGGVPELEKRVAARSLHSAPEAFALFRAELSRAPEFHARLAAALLEETADLYFGLMDNALELLRPALGLLPVQRLHGLHLAIGGELGDYREPLLGLPGGAPESWRGGGMLSNLFGRKQDDRSAAAADFESREVFGFRGKGPLALARAIIDPEPWPGGLQDAERYRVLLRCLDTPGPGGGASSPFQAVPELDHLRRQIQRLEQLAGELERWP